MYKLDDDAIEFIQKSTAEAVEKKVKQADIRNAAATNVTVRHNHSTAVAMVLVVYLHQKGNPLNFESKTFTKPLKEVATLMCNEETTSDLTQVWFNHISKEATSKDLVDLLTFLWTEQLGLAETETEKPPTPQ